MALLRMNWRSISTAAVLSTESPFCVTGSPGIPRGWLNSTYQSNFEVQLCSLFLLVVRVPLSFAYIEFSDRDSVTSAIGLHETLFRGRVLKVSLESEICPELIHRFISNV